MKLKCLRTVLHVGYTGHRPIRNITIERWCLIKCCSNHSITRLQQRKIKRHKNKCQKGRRKLEIILVINSLVHVLIKWKTRKNNKQTKRRKRIEIKVYVPLFMLVTLDTAHFERSLLNTDAYLNAVQIIQ